MKNLKLAGFIFIVLCFFVTTTPFYLLFLVFPMWTRGILTFQISIYSRLLLKVLGIKSNFKGLHHSQEYENFLIVSNHLSYLDVLILASRLPTCFVTSTDIKATPFLGQLAVLAGCLFVNRKNRSGLHNEINELRMALLSGLNVTVFPEATSTDGSEVLRFKRPLFESSIATGKPILPLTINYQTISGNPVNVSNRDVVCWYGEMDFFPHFLSLLEQKEVEVEIVINEPFLPELMLSIDLAMRSQMIVAGAFRPLNLTI